MHCGRRQRIDDRLHLQFKIDTDAPTVTGATPSRAADANGWFNKPVSLVVQRLRRNVRASRRARTASYGGPDSSSASVSGTCRDNAGNVSAASTYPLKYDATAPSVTASAARPPMSGGWYTSPVAVAFAGSDATSGIASCTGSTTYSGPDTAGTTLAGSCVDNAGNSTPGSFALKYDSTVPRLQNVEIAPVGDDVTLTWKQPADVASVAVTRTPGRKGKAPTEIYKGRTPLVRDTGLKAGVAYHYRLTSLDQAGNQSVAQVTTTLRALYAPAAGKTAHAGTALRWNADKSATLLQPPALSRHQEGAQLVARRDELPAAGQLDLRRPPLQADAGQVPLVRLARSRRARTRAVRQVARQQLLRRPLTRAARRVA